MSSKERVQKRLVTLIGELQARVGYRFSYSEPPNLCRDCRLYDVCIGVLEPGRLYEVVKVRGVKHRCLIHEGGVKVVEVVEAPVSAALPSKMAVEGLIIQYRPITCELHDCKLHSLCSPKWLKPNDRCRVVEVVSSKLSCSRGLNLAEVRLQRLSPS